MRSNLGTPGADPIAIDVDEGDEHVQVYIG
jgi:hypothetical protein